MNDARRAPRRDVALPRSDRWLMRGFEDCFLPGYLRRHFHVVAVHRQALTEGVFDPEAAVVVYANHASWWDPMVALYVRRQLWKEHRFYAPIDAEMLARYRIFSRMGFYGVSTGSHRGAAEFLKRSAAIVQHPRTSIWLTPEGRFCDVRDTERPLMPGLSHLAALVEATELAGPGRSRCVWLVPAAIEYAFWEERLPECLCWFGQPLRAAWGERTADRAEWDAQLTAGLRSAQQQLAAASIARDASQFEVLLSGHSGTRSFYDIPRRLLSRLRRKPIQLQHGDKF